VPTLPKAAAPVAILPMDNVLPNTDTGNREKWQQLLLLYMTWKELNLAVLHVNIITKDPCGSFGFSPIFSFLTANVL
jgi:hypothetical protein